MGFVLLREFDETFDHNMPPMFKFSKGWLDRFKESACLKLREMRGERADVDENSLQSRIDEIKQTLSRFDVHNIYNCDETGLYLRALPTKTVTSGPVHGHKIIRSARVSILFCSNSSGSDKRKPFILGKLLFIH